MKLGTLLSGLVGIVVTLLPQEDLTEETTQKALKTAVEIEDILNHVSINKATVTADVTFCGVDVVQTVTLTPDDAKVKAFLATLANTTRNFTDEEKASLLRNIQGGRF